MPGLFAMTTITGLIVTGTATTDDMAKGVMDRFRSMPMARTAVPFGQTTADLLIGVVSLTGMVVCGLAVGWRAHNGIGATAAAFGLLLLRYAVAWAGIALGLTIRKPETMDAMTPLVFPLTMLGNTFVPTSGMPAWLRVIAEWNPVSAAVAACRDLFGNPGAAAGAAWPLQHPVVATIGWSLLLLVVLVPLSTRLYRTSGRGAPGSRAERRAVAAGAGGEAAGAGDGLAAGQGGQAVPQLVGGGRLLVEPPLLDGREAVAAQGGLGQGGQRTGEGDRAAGEDQVHGPPVPDQAGEPDGAEVDQRHAGPPRQHAEHGALRGHAKVAPDRQLQAARHRRPLDRGQHRLGEPQPGRPHRPVAAGSHPRRRPGGDRLQVRPGAERAARAGQHGDRAVRVGVEGAEGAGQRGGGWPVDGVAALRPVDGHHRDRALALHQHGAFRHGVSLIDRPNVDRACQRGVAKARVSAGNGETGDEGHGAPRRRRSAASQEKRSDAWSPPPEWQTG